MKTVIRKSVFETNSSSTHSVSYARIEGAENFTFACQSPTARLLFIKAHVNHALEELRSEKTGKDDLRLVESFYGACLKVYCERENLDPQSLDEHLFAEAKKTFFADESRQYRFDYFKKCYHEESEHLCESFFECGALVECDCKLGDAYGFLRFFLPEGRNSDLEKRAETILYGEKSFICKEYYAGCKLCGGNSVY